MTGKARLWTDSAAWWMCLASGGALTAAYYLAVPYPGWRGFVYTMIGLSALAAVGYNLVHNKDRSPWTVTMLGLGLALYFLGDLTYTIYRFVLHAVPPYPGVAARIPLFVGMLMLARQARSIGQGTMRIFTPELPLANRWVHALSTSLRSLLGDRDPKDNRIGYTYVPIFSLNDGRNYGLEVIPAWRHPDFGLIDNDELSIVASDSNLMYEIEFRTISDVARLLYRWRGL